jgi:NAD(P)-dependent dehydrogenase (short-subunit alcohol dehydrogenase family)
MYRGHRALTRGVTDLFEEKGPIVYDGDVKDVAGGKGIEPVNLDATKPYHRKRLDAIIAGHGRIDVLVNNAGIVRTYGRRPTPNSTCRQPHRDLPWHESSVARRK